MAIFGPEQTGALKGEKPANLPVMQRDADAGLQCDWCVERGHGRDQFKCCPHCSVFSTELLRLSRSPINSLGTLDLGEAKALLAELHD
jgi:hypothetical protein